MIKDIKLWSTFVLWFDCLGPKCPQDEAIENIWTYEHMKTSNVCWWCNKAIQTVRSKNLFCVHQKAMYPNQWPCHWCIHIWVRGWNIYGKVRHSLSLSLKRYVDDNFCKLKKIRVEAFLIHLNLQHPIIKFTIKIFEGKVLHT